VLLNGIPKERRNQHPKSLLWESEVGSDWLKRADDTTTATRLFDREFPDLFSWLLDEMNALPLLITSCCTSSPKEPKYSSC
jgi:hypothetical protein